MIRTHGLSHIQIVVADVERSLRFYSALLGARELFRDGAAVFINTPGTHDVITLAEGPARPGPGDGVRHFGFLLESPDDADDAAAQIEAAGGQIVSRGEHGPGSPYVYALDPDGHTIEFWYDADLEPEA